eukprot:GHRQ01036362.1.p1 GENE.GHRQ01036362.1~~GHRQ01036362.1.p1  ORF type:complete len:144 (-),score=63.51 GHRQ01036362.1:251-682(-)
MPLRCWKPRAPSAAHSSPVGKVTCSELTRNSSAAAAAAGSSSSSSTPGGEQQAVSSSCQQQQSAAEKGLTAKVRPTCNMSHVAALHDAALAVVLGHLHSSSVALCQGAAAVLAACFGMHTSNAEPALHDATRCMECSTGMGLA